MTERNKTGIESGQPAHAGLTVKSPYPWGGSQTYPPPPLEATFTPGPFGNSPPGVWVRVGNLEFMWRMEDYQGVFHVREREAEDV